MSKIKTVLIPGILILLLSAVTVAGCVRLANIYAFASSPQGLEKRRVVRVGDFEDIMGGPKKAEEAKELLKGLEITGDEECLIAMSESTKKELSKACYLYVYANGGENALIENITVEGITGNGELSITVDVQNKKKSQALDLFAGMTHLGEIIVYAEGQTADIDIQPFMFSDGYIREGESESETEGMEDATEKEEDNTESDLDLIIITEEENAVLNDTNKTKLSD